MPSADPAWDSIQAGFIALSRPVEHWPLPCSTPEFGCWDSAPISLDRNQLDVNAFVSHCRADTGDLNSVAQWMMGDLDNSEFVDLHDAYSLSGYPN